MTKEEFRARLIEIDAGINLTMGKVIDTIVLIRQYMFETEKY